MQPSHANEAPEETNSRALEGHTAMSKKADRALYQSKQNGRNRVSVFQDSTRTPRLWKM